MQGYVEFNRFADLEASLELLLTQIHMEPMRHSSWKWAIISAHAALQGAICIALREGAGFATWKPKDFQEWKANYDIENHSISPKLDYFMKLFDRLFEKDVPIDRNSISSLNDTRNNLIHFNNGSYFIVLASIIRQMEVAIEATVEAAKLSRGIFFYEESQHERFHSLCEGVRDRLRHLAGI